MDDDAMDQTMLSSPEADNVQREDCCASSSPLEDLPLELLFAIVAELAHGDDLKNLRKASPQLANKLKAPFGERYFSCIYLDVTPDKVCFRPAIRFLDDKVFGECVRGLQVFMDPSESLDQYAVTDSASNLAEKEALRSRFDRLLAKLPKLRGLQTIPPRSRGNSEELQKRVNARYHFVVRHLLDAMATQTVARIQSLQLTLTRSHIASPITELLEGHPMTSAAFSKLNRLRLIRHPIAVFDNPGHNQDRTSSGSFDCTRSLADFLTLTPKLKYLMIQNNKEYGESMLEGNSDPRGNSCHTTAMPAITYLDLARVVATARHFSAALLHFRFSLKHLVFSCMKLNEGSWQDVFGVLGQIPTLEQVTLSSLAQGDLQVDFSRMREPEPHIRCEWLGGPQWAEAMAGGWLVIFDGKHLKSFIKLKKGEDYDEVQDMVTALKEKHRMMPLEDFSQRF